MRTWGPPSLRWGGHPAQGYAPSNRNRNEVPAGVPYFSWALGEGVSPSGYPRERPWRPTTAFFERDLVTLFDADFSMKVPCSIFDLTRGIAKGQVEKN